MSSANNIITLITPPDKYHGSDITILMASCDMDAQKEMLLALENIDLNINLCIYDPVTCTNIEWLLDTAQQSNIIILDLRFNQVSILFYGWLLNKSNCYYFCNDSDADNINLFNKNRLNHILEPLKILEE